MVLNYAFALICFACFALLCLLCLPCFACFAYFARFACFALLCFASLCFALLCLRKEKRKKSDNKNERKRERNAKVVDTRLTSQRLLPSHGVLVGTPFHTGRKVKITSVLTNSLKLSMSCVQCILCTKAQDVQVSV